MYQVLLISNNDIFFLLLEVNSDKQFDSSKPEGSDQGKNNYVKVYVLYCVL